MVAKDTFPLETMTDSWEEAKFMGFSKYIYQNDFTSEKMYLHKIKQSWTGKKCSHSVFLDVESAFDKIWHKAMVAKLNSIGIEGKS